MWCGVVSSKDLRVYQPPRCVNFGICVLEDSLKETND